jgi:hypothetical protein
MGNHNHDRHQPAAYEWPGIALVVVLLLAAWPNLLLAVMARLYIRRASHPYWWWAGAVCLGLAGAFLLYLHGDIYPLFRVELRDAVSLFVNFNRASIMRLLLAAWSVWLRSLLVFPLVAALMEFFSPKNLQEQLFAQERRRIARRERRRRRAARDVRKSPDQINGQAVLGVLIEDPPK